MKTTLRIALLVSAASVAVMLAEYGLGFYASAAGRTLWSAKYPLLAAGIYRAVYLRHKATRGTFSFLEALTHGLFIALCVGLLTGAFAYLYTSVLRPELYQDLIAQTRKGLIQAGTPKDEAEFTLGVVIRKYAPLGQLRSNAAGGLAIGIVCCLLVSSLFKGIAYGRAHTVRK